MDITKEASHTLPTSALIMSKDGFIWMDVTEQVKKENESLTFFQKNFELFELDDNDTDHLLETPDDVLEAIDNGSRIVVEVGHGAQTMAGEIIGVIRRALEALNEKDKTIDGVANIGGHIANNAAVNAIEALQTDVLALFHKQNKDNSCGFIFDTFSEASMFHRNNKELLETRENEVKKLPGVDTSSTLLCKNRISTVIGRNSEKEIIVVKPLLPLKETN